MNRKEFPGAIVHGEAWRHFCNQPLSRVGVDEYALQVRWQWFLMGWQAKGKQRMDLRGK